MEPDENLEYAALHPDVSYVTGSEPGNAEGKVVKYRALS